MLKAMFYAAMASATLFWAGLYCVSRYSPISMSWKITLGVNATLLFCIAFSKFFWLVEKRELNDVESKWLIQTCIAAFLLLLLIFILLTGCVAYLSDSLDLREYLLNPISIVSLLSVGLGGVPLAALVGTIAGSSSLSKLLR